MHGDLVRQVRGEVAVPKSDREATAEAKRFYDKARFQEFKMQGYVAVAAKAGEGMASLDAKLRAVAGDSERLQRMAMMFEGEAFQQVLAAQQGLRSSDGSKKTVEGEWDL